MFDMTKIGKKISQLRKENGLTQMELADKLAISYQAVSNWERGATMPDMLFPDTVKRISGLLPMTYAVDLMQGVFAGDSLRLHGKELMVLGSVTAVCAILGAVLYRKKDWT